MIKVCLNGAIRAEKLGLGSSFFANHIRKLFYLFIFFFAYQQKDRRKKKVQL